MLDDLQMAFRFARDTHSFLRHTLTPGECHALLTRQLQQRDEMFLRILERGIYGIPHSPYRALLNQAGLTLDHIKQWAQAQGIEATLHKLYEAGVYLTLDEFKGRKPLTRLGLNLSVHDYDFDNPLMRRHYEAETGGSTAGVGRRLTIDLDLVGHEAAYDYFFLTGANALARPIAVWRPIPPGTAGLKTVLRQIILGVPLKFWFSQSELKPTSAELKSFVFTSYILYASRWAQHPIPWPEYVPLAKAERIACWLAEQTARNEPALLDTNVASAMRVCVAAREQHLNIAGTLFRVGGEPFTESKAQVVAEAGCSAVSHYAMSEVGRVASACTHSQIPDAAHILLDKIAMIQRDKEVIPGQTVGALYCTTLHPGTPKLMLNVEIGDYGVLMERDCGCPLGQLGYHQQLHTIRSFEKLTTEGMNFVGADLLRVIEAVLPARFGGNPTDYQLVEEEGADAMTRISLVISPQVGAIDEALAVNVTLNALGAGPGGSRMMSDYWRAGGILHVVRREPYATSSAKIQALHILRPPKGAPQHGS